MADIDSDGLDILAGEYVLGTLEGQARAQFAALIERDSALRKRVRFWETALAPLTLTLVPVPLLSDTWSEIERLTTQAPETVEIAIDTADRQAKIWRIAAIAASAVAFVLLLILVFRGGSHSAAPVQAAIAGQRFAVLVDERRQPLWIAHTDAAGAKLEIAPVRSVTAPDGKAFELWLTTRSEPPRSLGVLKSTGQSIDHLPQSFANGESLSISVEQSTGSPTGAPTGSLDAVGALVDPGGMSR